MVILVSGVEHSSLRLHPLKDFSRPRGLRKRNTECDKFIHPVGLPAALVFGRARRRLNVNQ